MGTSASTQSPQLEVEAFRQLKAEYEKKLSEGVSDEDMFNHLKVMYEKLAAADKQQTDIAAPTEGAAEAVTGSAAPSNSGASVAVAVASAPAVETTTPTKQKGDSEAPQGDASRSPTQASAAAAPTKTPEKTA